MRSSAMSTYPFDLGSYSRTVTTSSAEAQIWFDRGLNWCYGFNHEEAIRCFQHAVDADPDCAMAYWGISYAWGPNYNKKWEAFDAADLRRSLAEARASLQSALDKVNSANDVEQALIQALVHRY